MNFETDVLEVLFLVSVFNIWSKQIIILLLLIVLFWICIINGKWNDETIDESKMGFTSASVEQWI